MSTTDLELAGRRYRDALRDRDRAIVEAHENRVGLREIGRQVGMSHQGVSAVIARAPRADVDALLAALRRAR